MSVGEPPLHGQVALVTGSTQGIGTAIARRLAAEGATVAVNGRARRPELDDLTTELDGIAAPADVSSRNAVETMVRSIEATAGPIGILVCNAAYMSMAPFLVHDFEDWWRVIDTNLTGTFHLVQAVLPGMRRSGGGRIIIITSYWGVTGWANATAYAASKSGLIALTKTLGRELARENIIVNAVAPGVIDTPQLAVDAVDAGVDLPTIHDRYAAAIPLGRIGEPDEVAAVVALLADGGVGSMVGQTIHVNGGEIRARA